MADFLRAAQEKLRGALSDIDARLAELEAERSQLLEHRAQLAAVLDGGAPSPPEREIHAPAASRPALVRPPRPAAPAPAPRVAVIQRDAAADRMLAAVAASKEPLRNRDLARAGGVGVRSTKDIIAALIAEGRLARSGKTSQTRYFLPGRAGRAPVDSEGDRGARRAHAAR